MKTETVKEVSMLVQLASEYGVSHASVSSLALAAAVVLSAVFATLALKYRWI